MTAIPSPNLAAIIRAGYGLSIGFAQGGKVLTTTDINNNPIAVTFGDPYWRAVATDNAFSLLNDAGSASASPNQTYTFEPIPADAGSIINPVPTGSESWVTEPVYGADGPVRTSANQAFPNATYVRDSV